MSQSVFDIVRRIVPVMGRNAKTRDVIEAVKKEVKETLSYTVKDDSIISMVCDRRRKLFGPARARRKEMSTKTPKSEPSLSSLVEVRAMLDRKGLTTQDLLVRINELEEMAKSAGGLEGLKTVVGVLEMLGGPRRAESSPAA